MKKCFLLLVALAMVLSCATALAERELIAPSVQTSSAFTADSNAIQDPYYFAEGYLKFDNISTASDGVMRRSFSGNYGDPDVVQAYVDTLSSGGYNLRLIDSYYQSYKNDTFVSYAFEYTGNARVLVRPGMVFKDGEGDVVIYAHIERSRIEGQFIIGKGLEFVDLGLRVGGGKVDTGLPGPSLAAELYRLDDGSYETGDGRFHVGLNQAVVYRDGTPYTIDASLERDQSNNREVLRINNFYRNDSIIYTLPYNYPMTGDVFGTRQMSPGATGSNYEQYFRSMESFLGWTFSNQILGVSHNGSYLICYADDHNDFDQAVARVMYWDPNRGEAVFYLCATFDTEPYMYEAVAAVTMGLPPLGSDTDGVFAIPAGSSLDVTFGGTEFMPHYELFTWEILEGSSLIELSGTRGQTCTVRAYDPGQVRLKVTYEYGTDGQDVLTGNKTYEHHTKTAEYLIVIGVD